MIRTIRIVLLALFLAMLAGPARAANEGLDELDKATEAKLNAKTAGDLLEVIRHCENALQKGLDKDNTEFANKILASTLIQRATLITQAMLEATPGANWMEQRKVALNDVERAAKLDPEQPEAFYRIAQLNLLPGGDPKRAAEALDKAIAVGKEEGLLKAQALTLRAELQKDSKKKLADLDEAIRIAPGQDDALRARAMAYLEEDKLDKALADLDAALKQDPDHLGTLRVKAAVLRRQKKFAEALKTVEQVQKLAPKSSISLVERARIHSEQTNLKSALADLDEAHRIDPGNAEVLLLRAILHQEMDEPQKAIADADHVLKLRPNLPVAMRLRAGLLAAADRFIDAADQLEKLIEQDPDDIDARTQLATVYMVARKNDKAIEAYAEIIKKDPKNWQALRGRGDTLLGIGKHAEAVADYERALKIKPDDSGILNNFAWVLCTSPNEKVRNGKRAIKLAEQACKLTDYKQAHILSTLGAAYAETGDFKTAMKWSAKAIELGLEDQKPDLQKEMNSYKAGKPIREIKTGNEPEDRPKPKRKRAKPESKDGEADGPETGKKK